MRADRETPRGEVLAGTSSPAKLRALTALGADHLVAELQEGVVDAVKRIYGKPRVTGAGGVNVAVNFTGGDTWRDTQRTVAHGGRMLTCGATAGFEVVTDARYLWTFEHRYWLERLVGGGSRGAARPDSRRAP